MYKDAGGDGISLKDEKESVERDIISRVRSQKRSVSVKDVRRAKEAVQIVRRLFQCLLSEFSLISERSVKSIRVMLL